jgi:hypothetical protein
MVNQEPGRAPLKIFQPRRRLWVKCRIKHDSQPRCREPSVWVRQNLFGVKTAIQTRNCAPITQHSRAGAGKFMGASNAVRLDAVVTVCQRLIDTQTNQCSQLG